MSTWRPSARSVVLVRLDVVRAAGTRVEPQAPTDERSQQSGLPCLRVRGERRPRRTQRRCRRQVRQVARCRPRRRRGNRPPAWGCRCCCRSTRPTTRQCRSQNRCQGCEERPCHRSRLERGEHVRHRKDRGNVNRADREDVRASVEGPRRQVAHSSRQVRRAEAVRGRSRDAVSRPFRQPCGRL